MKHQCGLLYRFNIGTGRASSCSPVKKMGIETMDYILLVLAEDKSSFVLKYSYSSSLVLKNKWPPKQR